MVFLDGPYIVRYVELFGHVAQIFVVAHYAGYVDVPFAGLVACQNIIQAVAHLAYEDGHARLYVVEVQAALHVVSAGIQCVDVFLDFVLRYEETVQFPFHAHEEYTFHPVDVLVEIDDVATVVCYEFCQFRYYSFPVGAVQKQDGCWFHMIYLKLSHKVIKIIVYGIRKQENIVIVLRFLDI